MTDDQNREDGRNQADAYNAETADGATGGSAGVQSPLEQKEPHNRLSKDHVLKRVFELIFISSDGLKELFANSRKLRVLKDNNFVVSPKPTNFEYVRRHPTTRAVPIFEVANDCVVSLKDGRVLIEFESFIKRDEEMTKLLRSLLALLLENDPLVSKNRLEPYLLLIYTGARKFPDSAFFRSFGILNFRVLCLNELDAEKEIVKLRKKVDKDPGFKTRSVWSLFLLLFLPLAKGFDRKRLSDCAALALKILDNPFREEYFKAMKSLYGPYLGDIDQADRTTEENLIMKSTAVPMPPELENINVVSRTNEMWELELEYKKELEEAEEYVKAAKKAAEKAEKKAKKAKKKAKKAAEKNSKEIASKLISEGLSLEKIAEFTGLTLEQVRSLAPA